MATSFVTLEAFEGPSHITLEAQGITGRISFLDPAGQPIFSLNAENAGHLLAGLYLAFEHNGWDWYP